MAATWTMEDYADDRKRLQESYPCLDIRPVVGLARLLLIGRKVFDIYDKPELMQRIQSHVDDKAAPPGSIYSKWRSK